MTPVTQKLNAAKQKHFTKYVCLSPSLSPDATCDAEAQNLWVLSSLPKSHIHLSKTITVKVTKNLQTTNFQKC